MLIPLPDIPNRCTAWWNPDSSAWQALAMYGASNGAPLRHLSYRDSVRAELQARDRFLDLLDYLGQVHCLRLSGRCQSGSSDVGS